MDIKFSIVITTFNRSDIIEKCVFSNIKNAGIPRKNFEIIWVDDGSEEEKVRELMVRISPNISLLKKENEGSIKSWNKGFVLTKNEWIVKASADVLYPKNWLGIISKYIKTIPQTDALGFIVQQDEYDIVRDEELAWPATRVNGLSVLIAKHIMGPFVFSRKLFKRVGYLDEEFGFYGCDDTDWSDRVKKANSFIYYIPTKKCFHFHQKKEELINKQEKSFEKNFPLYEIKNKIKDRIYYSPFI